MLPILLAISTAQAIPEQLNQQGRLLDSSGTPLEGVHVLEFNLYDDATGGTSQWDEYHSVDFSSGYYSVTLGEDPTNPLDEAVLAAYPLWLELEVDAQGPLSPRHQIGSVAYAQIAGLAEAVDGPVDATEVAVDGITVIDSTGAWVGPTPPIGWNDLSGIPSGFSDGTDDDALSGIGCNTGELLGWDGTAWTCLSDNSLDEQSVEDFITNGSIDLAPASTMNGSVIETTATDDDTLDALTCAAGQVTTWDGSNWICADQADSSIPMAEPGTCDASMAGQMYYDLASETLQICDGSDWKKLKVCNEVCPLSEDTDCGEEIYDDCGDSCGTEGTALNTDQCAADESVACGVEIADDCGNDCGSTGTLCSIGQCQAGVCVSCGDGVVDPAEECDDGNTQNGDGCNEDCTLPAVGYEEFTTPGSYSYTVPSGVYELVGLVIGGGASGNLSGGGSAGGGGGGAKSVVSVTPGDVIELTVGRGGGNSGLVDLDGGDSTIGSPFFITAGGGTAEGYGGNGTGGNLHNSAGGSATGSPDAYKLDGDVSETGDAGGAGAWLHGFGQSNGTTGDGIGFGGGGGAQNCSNYGGSCTGGSGGTGGFNGGDVGVNGGGPSGGATGFDDGSGCQGTYVNGGGGGSYGGGGGNDGSGQGAAAACALDLFFGGDGAHGYVRFEWGQ
jgi:cysteine-rich repeat protein